MGEESFNDSNCFAEQYKKYIPSALKQHNEIKQSKDPNAEVKKIMKLFEGGRSVDG